MTSTKDRRPGRLRLAGIWLAAALAAAGTALVSADSSSAADPPAGCSTSAGMTTCVFAYTGAAQTWTVPAGVTSATFDVYGAAGGTGRLAIGVGGGGGRAAATIDVTPDETLQVNVAGRGGDGVGGAGGFNGGGTSGSAGFDGGGGGGASDVRRGAFGLEERLLVAGGGGGSGFAGGGAGGGQNGVAGKDEDCAGGGGGTQSVGGAGGSAGGPESSPGLAGAAGTGGAGGNGNSSAGGGGGGGYYGGGGGGGADGGDFRSACGGGGGSGFGPAGTTFETGVRTGDGLVTITYTEPGTVSSASLACGYHVGSSDSSTLYTNATLGDEASVPAGTPETFLIDCTLTVTGGTVTGVKVQGGMTASGKPAYQWVSDETGGTNALRSKNGNVASSTVATLASGSYRLQVLIGGAVWKKPVGSGTELSGGWSLSYTDSADTPRKATAPETPLTVNVSS